MNTNEEWQIVTASINNLSMGLSNAVAVGRFLSPEYAKAIFKKFLQEVKLDVPKPEFVKPAVAEKKVEAKA